MAENVYNYEIFKSKKFDTAAQSTSPNLHLVNSDKGFAYLNPINLYLLTYKGIPSVLGRSGIDCRKAGIWFCKQYMDDINNVHFRWGDSVTNRCFEYGDVYYLLKNGVLVYFSTENCVVQVFFQHTSTDLAASIIKEVQSYKVSDDKKSRVHLLTSGETGLSTIAFKLKNLDINLQDNYNDDLKEVHEIILKRLSTKNDKGLVLLHGAPGTGKTSYIRHLMSQINKNVIFLPPNLASHMTNPDLISILIENSNSIFVIEDAENIILDRNASGSSSVSALLNISDGLLSDCLNVQIICSFNTDISRVDNALMRKGRMIAKYEFKELEVSKAQALSDKLGNSTLITRSMSLTDIYNQDDKEFSNQHTARPVGFKTA